MLLLLEGKINLLKELDVFSTYLRNSDTLVLKQEADFLECQFVKGGIPYHELLVRSKALAGALKQLNAQGIIEGASFTALKHNFCSFSLHVKARLLYLELSGREPDYALELGQLAVA